MDFRVRVYNRASRTFRVSEGGTKKNARGEKLGEMVGYRISFDGGKHTLYLSFRAFPVGVGLWMCVGSVFGASFLLEWKLTGPTILKLLTGDVPRFAIAVARELAPGVSSWVSFLGAEDPLNHWSKRMVSTRLITFLLCTCGARTNAVYACIMFRWLPDISSFSAEESSFFLSSGPKIPPKAWERSSHGGPNKRQPKKPPRTRTGAHLLIRVTAT